MAPQCSSWADALALYVDMLPSFERDVASMGVVIFRVRVEEQLASPACEAPYFSWGSLRAALEQRESQLETAASTEARRAEGLRATGAARAEAIARMQSPAYVARRRAVVTLQSAWRGVSTRALLLAAQQRALDGYAAMRRHAEAEAEAATRAAEARAIANRRRGGGI